VPIVEKAVWASGSPPGFDLRTIQPVVCCYTKYAIPAHIIIIIIIIIIISLLIF